MRNNKSPEEVWCSNASFIIAKYAAVAK